MVGLFDDLNLVSRGRSTPVQHRLLVYGSISESLKGNVDLIPMDNHRRKQN